MSVAADEGVVSPGDLQGSNVQSNGIWYVSDPNTDSNDSIELSNGYLVPGQSGVQPLDPERLHDSADRLQLP